MRRIKRENLCRIHSRLAFLFIYTCLFCLISSGSLLAVPVEIKITTNALGHGICAFTIDSQIASHELDTLTPIKASWDVSGKDIELDSLRPIDVRLFEQNQDSKDKPWKFKFSGIDQPGQGEPIDSFSIRANDKSLLDYITTSASSQLMFSGMNVSINTTPEPATILILGFSSLTLFGKTKI